MTTKPIPEGENITGSITKHMDRRFLSSVDLAGQGTVWLTVDHLSKHKELVYQNGQKDADVILMHFKELDRPLKLNATNIKAIILRTGTSKVDDWAGVKIPLKAEPGTYFGQPGFAVRVDVRAKIQTPKQEKK
jgi:hypothetical protein